MPITGTFLADFSQFVSEVQTAVVALDGLTSDADKAQAALTEVAGVDPAGLEATAAAAKDLGTAVADVHPGLTATATAARQVTQDTDSMSGAFAQAKSLAAALGIGLSVGAVVAYGRAMIETAGEIQKMADATGLSTDQVQGLMAAAAQTSTPIGAFETALQALQQKIGAGDTGLIAATRALGLSWAELARMSPYEAMTTYAGALQGVDDQNRQAALGVDVFGKSWRELGAAVKAGALEVADNAPKMSAGAITTLNALDAKLKETKQNFLVFAADIVAAMAGEKTSEGLKHAKEQADAAAAALPKVTDAARAMVEPLTVSTTATVNLALQQRLLAADVERAAASAAFLTKWKDAMVELHDVGQTWYQTLLSIDGEVVEAVRYYLAAGVQQSVLAAAYGLTSEQVAAVADGVKAYTGANEAALAIGAKVLEAHAAEVKALQDDVNARNAAILKTKEADATNQAYYVRLADEARVAYELAAQAGSGYTAARIEQLRQESEAATATLQNWQTAAEQAMSSTGNAVDATRAQLAALTAELATPLATIRGEVAPGYVSPFGPTGTGGTLPAGAGGRVSAADADAYRPASYGAIGNVFIQPPTSLVGRFRTEAPVINVQAGAVTMNYPLMNDPVARDQIGQLVGDAILERVTRTGARV